MSYITEKCFSRNWILKQRQSLGRADPGLLEKTIYTFELVAHLSLRGLDFVFKGGTSLLLLDPQFRRLSIDVDIITEETSINLMRLFNDVIHSSPFIRWDEQTRSDSPIPKRHFRFYFDSQINRRENYALLDVLSDKAPHPELQTKEVVHPFIEIKDPVSVTVPSLNSMTADKLAAFAPETIGVPFGKEKSLQMIKQLIDLGELFQHDLSIAKISDAYEPIVRQELGYKQKPLTLVSVLKDTLNTSYLICQIDLRGAVEDEHTSEIRLGIRQMSGYLVQGRFSLTEAKIAASRAAFLASFIKSGTRDIRLKDSRYDAVKEQSLVGITLPEPYSRLNRLKTIIPECFYYWSKVTEEERKQKT